MLELPHDEIVIPFGDTFRITDGALYKSLEASFEQLIHLVVIVIVVPDAEHTLNVIPDGPSETGRVDFAVLAHRVIRKIVGCLEFVVQKITDIVVQTIDQRVTVIVPRIVLDAEGRYVVQLAALKQRRNMKIYSYDFLSERNYNSG